MTHLLRSLVRMPFEIVCGVMGRQGRKCRELAQIEKE